MKDKSKKRTFIFRYKCLDDDYYVEVIADNLNKGMILFAKRYSQIQEVYEITLKQ